jgi:hypothetical protein
MCVTCEVGLVGSFFYSLAFLHVDFIFIIFSYTLIFLKLIIETQETKGEGKLYLCEETMEREGCHIFFCLVLL